MGNNVAQFKIYTMCIKNRLFNDIAIIKRTLKKLNISCK